MADEEGGRESELAHLGDMLRTEEGARFDAMAMQDVCPVRGYRALDRGDQLDARLSEGPANVIFFGGPIITVNDAMPRVEAIAVR